MIDNMYSIMARINELQSRFGMKRHNAEGIADAQKSGTFDNMLRSEIEGQTGVGEKAPAGSGKAGLPGVDEIKRIARYHAQKNNMPPSLVEAVIQNESGYNPRAVSPRGAMGLMQLMPSVAKQYGVQDPFSPDENIGAGVSFLKGLMEKYNWDYKKALSAYNAGETAVDRKGGVPDIRETREYVQRVITSYLENKE